MGNVLNNDFIANWLNLTQIQMKITIELEAKLQENYGLSLKEFYLLLFLSEAPEQKLKLQQLESMVGLSQSAVSRLVNRFEAKGCGALERMACRDDRRSIYTSLTPIGQHKLDRALVTFEEVLLAAFPEQEVAKLLQQMLRIKQAEPK
ncbi:MarR family winged helix-turn-helix transcriptional regulator [Paenibacillus sp. 481]|uniref:MarR family winged helix-turn-helix transcriptional regulator n=1 Tax=Paenibacillus sp. 481 TaxID=2835869 RepID=UPI001E5C80A4|nr:MarR family transcriptional regulator [Paenibacillus sp. 481]UHA73230.1 MarR family transcriptional regulator [Paenibacillus sp. 481]